MVRPGDENPTIFLHERPKKNSNAPQHSKKQKQKNGDNLRESLPWNKEAKKEKIFETERKKNTRWRPHPRKSRVVKKRNGLYWYKRYAKGTSQRILKITHKKAVTQCISALDGFFTSSLFDDQRGRNYGHILQINVQ